jgi:outer membrane lipoprotein-sorting protein
MFKLSFVLFFNLLTLSNYFAYSQTKEIVFNQLKNNFSSLDKISFSFQSMENKSYQGKLIASKDGKYKLFLPDKIIISDGNTIWNYTIKDKLVVISNNTSQNNSLQTIFFNIIHNFFPTELKDILNSRKGKLLQLNLQSKTNKQEQLVLFLDQKSLQIQQIIFNYNNATGNYTINKLIINPKVADSEFTFKTPKGVEEIDLR